MSQAFKKQRFVKGIIVGFLWIGAIMMLVFMGQASLALSKEPVNPLAHEYPITIDSTSLTPPTWWHMPGMTPLIWTMDPISSDAYRTTEVQTLSLKPGEYRFGTFTFDFPFRVTMEGVLEFTGGLDQCVGGRGTATLNIRCARTQPYGGQPDY